MNVFMQIYEHAFYDMLIFKLRRMFILILAIPEKMIWLSIFNILFLCNRKNNIKIFNDEMLDKG